MQQLIRISVNNLNVLVVAKLVNPLVSHNSLFRLELDFPNVTFKLYEWHNFLIHAHSNPSIERRSAQYDIRNGGPDFRDILVDRSVPPVAKHKKSSPYGTCL